MGKAGPLAIVTPDEFRKRTALTFSSRSGTTLALDEAYDNYYVDRSESAGRKLYARLSEYLVTHGGAWNKCERNVASGGLLEYLHDTLRPGAMSPAAALEMDKRAAARIRDIEIPHARFGVLYLLSGVRLETDAVSMGIETLGAVGAVVGVGMTTNFNDLGSKDAVSAVAKIHDVKISASDLAKFGGVPALQGTATVVGKILAPPTASGPAFPTSAAALDAASAGLSEVWNKNKYLGGLAYAGATVGFVPVAAVTLLADAGQALWAKLKAAFTELGDMLKRTWRERYDVATVQKLSACLKQGTLFAMNHIMKHAVPYIGVIEVGTGLAQAISEACSRIASWVDRRRIRIQSGHPLEIANAIEHQMTLGLCAGLGNVLKGAAKVAVSTFAPGLGSLVSAAMSMIEWLIKFISRLGEQFAIDAFLLRARSLYDTEKRRSKAEVFTRKNGKSHLVYEPNTEGGSIITDTKAFTEFFRDGCQASPLIPMLVLNSGLGGSLMTLVKLFDADGSQSIALHGGRKEFDIGNAYFTRLKRYSVDYMKNSGFKFLSLQRPGDAVMAGYLGHATGTGKERQSHVEAGTWGGRLVAVARA